jgi:23S rRNA pseudouridine1911/1915/1917 synthase
MSVNFRDILYEDNHIIIVNKKSGDIVQGDKTGDTPLSETVSDYIAKRDNKPGKAFIGVPHRLDRPVSGAVVFAKTSKGLSRMGELFKSGPVDKTYWAIVEKMPPEREGELVSYLARNQKQNKSYEVPSSYPDAKEARLRYRLLAASDKYYLLEVKLLTGRHHQIRCQLSSIGCVVKGDLKYGAKRSNPDGSISLHARSINFVHPVKGIPVYAEAPVPEDSLWKYFEENLTVL